MSNFKNISSGTRARTFILILALINQVLHMFDLSPIPINDDTITALITNAFTIGAALVAWWQNNSFTKHAIKADAYMEKLKDS